MQEHRPQRDSSLKAATRLLDDVLIEIVDTGGYDRQIEGSSQLVSLEGSANARNAQRQVGRNWSAVASRQRSSWKHAEPWELAELRSPGLERMSIRAAFAQIYYPKSRTPATSTFRAIIQQDDDLRSNLALSHAMDAVCLTELGSVTQSQAYLYGGTQHYQCALGMFRRQLKSAIDAQQFDSKLLATCHALMFCQRFSTFGGNGDEGSYMHMRGLGHMMTARGLDSFTSEFDLLLLEDYQHYALRLGMIHRRSIDRRLEKAWAERQRSSAGPRYFPQLNSLAFQLPGLLEACDNACAEIRAENLNGRAGACTRAMKLMAELGGLETTLQAWLQGWYSSTEQLPYRPVPVRSLFFLQRHLSDKLLDTFPSALDFPSFASAATHSRFWACLLLIRSTSAELCSAVIPDERPSARQLHNVTECADDLCLSMAYLCGAQEHGLAGPAAVTGHLRIAFEWYQKTEDRAKMDWCKAIAEIVQERGLSSPTLVT
ncbi:hypothetical protein M409DRAFT_15765 [Zasmidium cellare ATCC 36951]|uniref:Transcription factor domain-containing protein n=1 Tax=Zasmidium cellare ATCC 36951 TaxID=1080233 RepID=A0A6A6D240_ZASCE|nr:uncharacterized protein M409DRAFT_15765 [Zasmidium cellare ATCC 36951]KAF2173484.1 hypothetical protein M409DRAFT_15765 [Zasmidium cellare ATCC 36951]